MHHFSFAYISFFLFFCLPVQAHEFWITPGSFTPSLGEAVTLKLQVGENIKGDPVPFSKPYVAAFRHYSKQGVRELASALPTSGQSNASLTFDLGGTHMLAIDTHPNQVTLSADRFNAYLHDEGLDAIIKMREIAGKASLPGRERYRRHIKTVLNVDNKTDATAMARTGQRLEIIPLTHPTHKSPGDMLNFLLLFEGKPLVGTLVKAWHQKDEQVFIIRARSDKDGIVRFTLPFSGAWMMSTVHMIAVLDAAETDWESFWGNLTFAVPAKD